jgi:hypothetical protein
MAGITGPNNNPFLRRVVRAVSTLLLAITFFVPTQTYKAQDGTPPPDEKSLIRGTIVNHTTGEFGPEGTELMLHIYDGDGNSLGMTHGITGPDGWFEFEDTRAEQHLIYLVMATYQGATHISEPVSLDVEGELPLIEVPIYETTTDAAELLIDQLHFLLGTGQGGLTVAEFYTLSNLGNRTIIGSMDTDEAGVGNIAFTLPHDAANVSFPSASPERFQVFPGGFSDTSSIPPGVRSRQVVVSYVLPYESSSVITRTLSFDVNQISILVSQQSGLQVTVVEPYEQAVEFLGTNSDAFDVTSLGSMPVGSTLDISVAGSSPNPSSPEIQSRPGLSDTATSGALLGAATLGLALIIWGVWWWRRNDDLPGDESKEEAIELL